MSRKEKRNVEFLQLNGDVQLGITSWLPDRDRIRLMGKVVRGVGAQVTSCTIYSGPGLDIDRVTRDFQRLENVVTLTIHEQGWGWSSGSEEERNTRIELLRIVAMINPRIVTFKFGQHDNPPIHDIAIYIEQVKQAYPEYDASSLAHTFEVNASSASTNPGLADQVSRIADQTERCQ